jgi:hypothetical protein
LDDTLEPMEIKKIGQKVAESDAAQELIARIKQTTRRRRITTPPATGPGAFDANTVADYLDNELSSEQVAELEKICLESDVHLAEIASCHQILTLVLGEPALVPPTAKERMYALVQGREAIPFRKASAGGANASAPTAADADADEMFLLGLPFYRRGSWLRWALPVAGVLLLAVLAVALWQTISPLNQPAPNNQFANVTKPDNNNGKKSEDNNTKNAEAIKAPKPDDTDVKKPGNTEVKKPDDTNAKKSDDTTEVKKPDISPEARKAPPSRERVEAGSYYFDPRSTPSVLVQRKDDQDSWHRLKPAGGTRVFTNDRLVSLPGYASELRLSSGVHLLLRGHVPQFSMFPEMDYLQDCAVVLHKGKDVDADLTLERGRLFVSNHKDKDVVVRIRFNREVWDLTLQPDAEVILDLLRRNRSDIDYMSDEEPMATLHLFVLHGKAGLAIDYQHYPDLSAPPGPSYFLWDNKGPGVQGPIKQDKVPPFFAKVLPVSNRAADAMDVALKAISHRMGKEDKAPTVALEEALQNPDQPMQHMLAIYCLGALDEIEKLIGILGSTDAIQAVDRDTAIFTLRRWLGRSAENGKRLYNIKTKSGLLLSSGQEYRPSQAQAIYVLLHDFTVEASTKPETYDLLANYLMSDKVAIAELARWHLVRLPLTNKIAELREFNATAPPEDRERAAAAVRRAVTTPPRAPTPGKTGKDNPAGKLPRP